MRFGVLGPLAVWTADGTRVNVRESKVRALLAALLVHEGRPVSADRLIDDLWGERLPLNPRKTLQTRVWQLRRALEDAEPGGRDLVVSQPPGYLLRVDPARVDMGRFRDLTAQARISGDARTRAELLSDALRQWRGPAFADFQDAEFAGHLARRLEEERLVVLEEQAEARLESDDRLATALAGELGELVARYPLRERLCAVYMRALYLAGRQAEALAAYSGLRHRLAEELGLDPGPELATLHQSILEQATHLSLTSGAAPRTTLPIPLSALIGRADVVGAVRSALGTARLVTLTGPGGVGKTRLAVETAGGLVDAFPDGVWLVELTMLDRQDDPRTSAELTDLVAAVLGLRDDATTASFPSSGPVSSLERLTGALCTKQLLLVLDNCEHVTEPAAELVEQLLSTAPGLRILATSRQPLAVDGEQVWPVSPLEPPAPGASIEAVRKSSAVRLFLARASAAVPGFELTADNADAVATICRRLDGIPLALELAATRLRALGARELAARVDDRFRLLAGEKRGAPARQRTLRAMIDWSWELLTEAERLVLRRLSVHAGGCTIEAAETTCVGGGVRAREVLDLLARLVDRSLVVMTEAADGPRYRLLESVAAYSHERLDEAGESERIRQLHRRYYTELAERAEPHLRSRQQQYWLRRLDAETANLHRALDDAIQHDEAEVALRLVNALGWYWFLRGRLGEARRLLNLVLPLHGQAPAATRAVAAVWQAGITLLIRDATDPNTVVPSGVLDTVNDTVADPAVRAWAEWFLSFAQSGFDTPATTGDRIDRLLSAYRAAADDWGVAAVLITHTFALAKGDIAEAGRLGRQSLTLFEELGDSWGQMKARQRLATLSEINGDYEDAARLRREGLCNAEELGLWTEAAYELSGLGRSALLAGDYGTAEEFHTRAMRLAAEQSHQWGVQHAEVGLGLGARRQGKLDTAETHLRNWLDWCRRWNGTPGLALILAELGFIAEQRGDASTALDLHLDGYTAAQATGDQRAIALALEGLAGAHSLAGHHHHHAARLLGAAAALRKAAGAPLPAAEHGDIDRITARIRHNLPENVFVTEFENGRRNDLDVIAGNTTAPNA
ncbi:AfsR family transcriptional regulator [Amycolatopsis sp. WAC 01416]|uniref:BTAD domain-containing putative transcriptional regulator n=1 Tax=Amycolatopsis sp. WAC 01416 TaxID=2203196 RepID=UPI000F78E1FD|nr:BTAD domain-containing putative transcriptional regulator [Amycolatopsis sp. WAC 01416]RSN27226.1 AfsR family transcriptional regulator [Amycolatopsis sp. WAC 01416]